MPVTLRQRTVRRGKYTEDYEADLPLPPNPKFVHPDVPFNPHARPAAFPTIPLDRRFVERSPEPTRVQRLLHEIDPDESGPPSDEELLHPEWTSDGFNKDLRLSWTTCRTVDFTHDISDGMKLFLVRVALHHMTISQAIHWLQLGDIAVDKFLDLFRKEINKAQKRAETDAIINQCWRTTMTEAKIEDARIEWLAFRETSLAKLEYPNREIIIEARDIYLGNKFIHTFFYKEDDEIHRGVDFISNNIQADIIELFGSRGKLRNMYVSGCKYSINSGEPVSEDDSMSMGKDLHEEPLDEAVSFGSVSKINELHDVFPQRRRWGICQDDDEVDICAQEFIDDENYLPSRSEVVAILRNIQAAPLATTIEELDYPDEFISYFNAWKAQQLRG